MFNVSKWGTHGKLAQVLMPDETRIRLLDGQAARFFLTHDDWFYATIRDKTNFEHVKVIDVRDGVLIVERGQDNTEARQWGVGACIAVEWNPAQICEHIRHCVMGFETVNLKPGTYCLTCQPCIDVNKYGQITAIRQGEGC